MTEGSCFWQLVLFSLPLLVGNVFQQLYNTVDSIIVGNFIGSDALAAVGSSAAVINMVLGLFIGISVGAGIVISAYYGAEDEEQLKKTIQTTVAFALLSGLAVMAIGLLFTPRILQWMDTPDSVMQNSVLYFRIFFLGGVPLTLYNMGSGILRAIGESGKPLYYLVVSSFCNIVLDVLFVVLFGFGIAGAAIATVISQAVSAVLVWNAVKSLKFGCPNGVKDIKIYSDKLHEIIRYGVPAGLQNMVISFSNIIVQAKINYFDEMAIAGCGAYEKLYSFANLPINSLSMAITTFTSQNKGAKKPERIRRGFKIGLCVLCVYAAVSGIVIYQFAPQLVGLFSKEPEVTGYGTAMARTVAPFYAVVAVSHGMSGYLRGIGRVRFPMYVSVLGMCIIRIAWLAIMVPITENISTVFQCYPVTWTLCVIAYCIYLLFIKYKAVKPDKNE